MASGNRPLFYCPDYAEDVKSCIVSPPGVKRENRVTA
nr:MAG TPA: Golgi reassembly-stacking protein 1, Golgin fold six-stranded anti parallel-barrel.96A [Caudoviricetes sp.]